MEEAPNKEPTTPTPTAEPSAATPKPAEGAGVAETTPAPEAEAPAGEQGTAPNAEPTGFLHAEEEPKEGDEGKPDEGKPDEGKPDEGKPDEGPKTLGAPEGDYEYKEPEGTVLDPTVMGKLSSVAKELNLSQEAVQKLVDEVAPSWKAQGEAQLNKYRTEWQAQSKADEEFGGQNFEANMKGTNKAYTRFTTPELRNLFAQSGLDSHPEVIRMFYRLYKSTGEGGYVRGSNGSGMPKDDFRNFYKGMNP